MAAVKQKREYTPLNAPLLNSSPIAHSTPGKPAHHYNHQLDRGALEGVCASAASKVCTQATVAKVKLNGQL